MQKNSKQHEKSNTKGVEVGGKQESNSIMRAASLQIMPICYKNSRTDGLITGRANLFVSGFI